MTKSNRLMIRLTEGLQKRNQVAPKVVPPRPEMPPCPPKKELMVTIEYKLNILDTCEWTWDGIGKGTMKAGCCDTLWMWLTAQSFDHCPHCGKRIKR